MAVEILSVGLEDETIERLADAIVRRLGNQTATQSNPPSPQTQTAQSAQPPQQVPDPWGTTQIPQAQQQAPPPQAAPQATAPACSHGAMRFVPAGFSQSSGKPYRAFWGCPAPRGAQQCRSVKAE